MNHEERGRAVEKLFDADAPVATLMLFENDWTDAQRRRMAALLEKATPTTADAWVTLAWLDHHEMRDDDARRALECAIELLRLEREDWCE